MMNTYFNKRLINLRKSHSDLIAKKNKELDSVNGIYHRFESPVLTEAHIPLSWRFHFNEKENPYLLERIGMNAVFNSGAIKFNDKYVLVTRVEGANRKSFFAIAESENGIDHFTFHPYPVRMPGTDDAETNLYDMRLIAHEDGWIYGIFCTERRDFLAPDSDQSAAIAQCGISRTKDFVPHGPGVASLYRF